MTPTTVCTRLAAPGATRAKEPVLIALCPFVVRPPARPTASPSVPAERAHPAIAATGRLT
jgi:hypothetical protein